jgi:hypothetical protein
MSLLNGGEVGNQKKIETLEGELKHRNRTTN